MARRRVGFTVEYMEICERRQLAIRIVAMLQYDSFEHV